MWLVKGCHLHFNHISTDRLTVDWCMRLVYEGAPTVQRSSNRSSPLISAFSYLCSFMLILWTSIMIDRLIDHGPQTNAIRDILYLE